MRRLYTIPLLVLSVAILASGCTREVTTVEQTMGPSNCFTCHSDQSTFLVAASEQYGNSQHASAENLDRNYAPCSGCHVSEGWVERNATGQAPGLVSNPTAINCFTCHAPHTRGDFSLRKTSPAMLQNGAIFDLGAANICADCHQARRDNTTYVSEPTALSRFWGPHHSTQGDLLIGSNGYEYAGFSYEQTAHRSATDNGCLDCHFKETSNYVVGGHSFNMVFDTGSGVIENTAACADCHGGISSFDFNGVQTEVDSLVSELRSRLLTAGLIDGADHPASTTVSADSAGAVWNFLVVLEDRSRGIHNPDYARGLLQSSILFMDGQLRPNPLQLGKAANAGQ